MFFFAFCRYLVRSLPNLQDGMSSFFCQWEQRWRNSFRSSDIRELCNCSGNELQRTVHHLSSNEKVVENDVLDDVRNKARRSSIPKRAASSISGQSAAMSSTESRSVPEKISLSKIFAILCFCLSYCKESILPSDIIRWNRLLLFPCVDPAPFIPDDQLTTFYRLSSNQGASSVLYNEVEWETAVLVELLEIPKPLPKTSLLPIIDRFIAELNLPKSFLPVVGQLSDALCFSEVTLDFTAKKDHTCIRCPENAEALAMSLIIFSLRIFFGLDDATELFLTTQTRLIQEKITDDTVLFDILEWMHYLDCRRLALFSHTSLFEKRSLSAALAMVSLNMVAEKRKLTWSRLERNKFQDENYEDIQTAFQDLEVSAPENFYIQLPVTLRPFRAHSSALSAKIPVLKVYFDDDSMDHILQAECGLVTFQTNGLIARELALIAAKRKDAYQKSFSVRSCNFPEQLRLLPCLEAVPSSSLNRLFCICAEMIELKPESLLGNFMFVEACLLSQTNGLQAKFRERMQRLGMRNDIPKSLWLLACVMVCP